MLPFLTDGELLSEVCASEGERDHEEFVKQKALLENLSDD